MTVVVLVYVVVAVGMADLLVVEEARCGADQTLTVGPGNSEFGPILHQNLYFLSTYNYIILYYIN